MLLEDIADAFSRPQERVVWGCHREWAERLGVRRVTWCLSLTFSSGHCDAAGIDCVD